MGITTYAELKSAIADWLLRDDLTAVIPSFVSLAEAKFNRNIRDYRMMKRLSVTVDAEYEDVPSDWLQTSRYQLDTTPITTLEFVTPDQAAEEARRYNGAGRPLFFSVVGTQFQHVPAPDAAYTGALTYYSRIPALSDSVTTNWLLEKMPNLYLHAALKHAAIYLDEDALAQRYAALMNASIQALQADDWTGRFNRASMRVSGPTP